MGKIQAVTFQSVEDFLSFLPDNERKLVDYLRAVILDVVPQCREKLALNVPFYYRFSRICFLWPASVPWGKVKGSGVHLGFVQGYRMRDELNFLEQGSRKQVFIHAFEKPDEIDEAVLKAYLQEAVHVDERLFGNRKKIKD